MARKSFAAHCARNHDRIDFTDPAAFEAHMLGEHKARKPSGPSLKPYPWKAPKAPAGTEALARVLASEPTWATDVQMDGAIEDGTWRFDRDTGVPMHALPPHVRPILEGAIARGEKWLVNVSGPAIRLEVLRDGTGEAGTTTAARVELVAGKVRKVYTVDPSRQNAPTGFWEDKITRVRELFPATEGVVAA